MTPILRFPLFVFKIRLAGWLAAFSLAWMASRTHAADIFVDNTGFGGAYTTIEAAFAAAGASDTIYVRGGQTFTPANISWGTAKSGVKLYGGWNGNQITPLSNADINPNTSGNLAVANGGRLAETVINGGTGLNIGNTAGDNVSGATIRGFDFQKSTTAININGVGAASTVSNLDLSNNKITITGGQGINFQQMGANGSAQGVLISGNRITFDASASAKTALQLGPSSPTLSKATVFGNYVVDQSSATGNNRAMNADRANQLVVAGNLFDAMSNQSVGNLVANKGVVIAENEFQGAGKTQRAIIAYPLSATAGDQDLERILISNNTASGHVGQVIDLTVGGAFGTFSGDDGSQDIWVRHNLLNADAAQMQASSFNGVSLLSLRFNENTDGNGPVDITNNEMNVTGNRTSFELQGIRIAGQAPTAATGGLLIQDNVITATGATGTTPHIGIRIAPGLTTSFGTMGDIDATIQNNTIDGFLTAGVGVYNSDGTVSSAPTVGNLAVGATVGVNSNNIQNNGTGVQAGGGASIGVGGSYFNGNTTDTSGNVSGLASGSANTVAGRDANYVTFRGDHNLNNAVDAADAAVLVAGFGTSGPSATYFDGDSTLDQVVDLDDGKVFARFFNQPIAASGVITNPVSAGAPSISYDSLTGSVSFTSGAQGSIWGLRLLDGTTVLSPTGTTPTALNSNWLYTNQSTGVEFYDDSFGTLGDFAANGIFATLTPGLTAANFGQVEYFFGQGASASSAFTSMNFVAAIPEPSTAILLGLGTLLLARRRRAIRRR